jgi:hypothetical protein
MGKRFFDTNKFEDTWYFELPCKYKLFYDYILAKCDSVGVWKPNIKMASFTINEQLDANEFIELCGIDRLYVKENGDWYLKKFCDFQYGTLNENSASKPIQSYIQLLKKHSLWIVYTKGIYTLKEKEREKDIEKEEEIYKKSKDFKNVTSWDNCHLYEYSELSEELKKMYDEDTWNTWKVFNKHLDENFEHIREIESQMKIHDYVKLRNEYIIPNKISKNKFIELLSAFNNYKPGKDKYNSVTPALMSWLKKELK